jgi:hypothetical protein
MSTETAAAQSVGSSAWLGRFNRRTENPKGWAELRKSCPQTFLTFRLQCVWRSAIVCV